MARAWMPLYIGDYRADTAHLRMAEHGAYLLLIMHYWQHGTLPLQDERLASIASATLEEWLEIKPAISSFFDSKWRHKRIEQERKRSAESAERRAESGRKGGLAKSSNATAKSEPSNATACVHVSQSQSDIDPRGSIVMAVSPPKAKARQKHSKTEIDEDANPTANDELFASNAGMSTHNIKEEWAQFRDHHRKLGNRMADWPAAWRTWVRNVGKFVTRTSAASNGHTYLPNGHATIDGVYVKSDTPQGNAWDAYSREKKGKSQVWDKKGGWHLPSEWPPEG